MCIHTIIAGTCLLGCTSAETCVLMFLKAVGRAFTPRHTRSIHRSIDPSVNDDHFLMSRALLSFILVFPPPRLICSWKRLSVVSRIKSKHFRGNISQSPVKLKKSATFPELRGGGLAMEPRKNKRRTDDATLVSGAN